MRKLATYPLFLVVIVLLWISIADSQHEFILEPPLKGAIQEVKKPTFSLGTWFEGTYQDSAEKWLNDNIGGRNFLIRLRNQVYFDVFKIAKANGVIVGKNGVLFEKDYIEAFYGRDFQGEEYLTDKLTRWKHVQQGLDSIGVKAFLALAPGKAGFFEDAIPDRMRGESGQMTNYRFVTDWAQQNDLNLLDFQQLYHLWEDTSQYPLYTKGGIHWTEASVAYVCDTLRGYVQNLTGRPLQTFGYYFQFSDKPRGSDNDIADGMNLLVTPMERGLPYPRRQFGTDSTIAPTHFLAIGDSYYFTIFYSGCADRLFTPGGFWFYFREGHPRDSFGYGPVTELDILAELKKQDVVMLLMTEPTLKRFGWGSVEKLEELLYPKKQ